MIGSTNYLYSNYIQKIIIAATYGFLPLITLPGSILSRQSLDSVGFFAPKWRAGEDVDFLVRLNSLFSNNLFSNVPNSYVLRSSNLFYYFFKWLRNYSDSVPYQKLTAQSHALILLFAIFILLFSFNWNWVVAGWNESFPLYVAHITKYTFAVCVLAYIFLRGVYLPIKKASFSLGRCTLIDLLPVLLVSLLLDLAKTLGFFLHLFICSPFIRNIYKAFRERYIQ